jgi:hypothetical protein
MDVPGLLQVLPGIVGEETDDASGHGCGGKAQDANKRLELVDFANDLGLLALDSVSLRKS